MTPEALSSLIEAGLDAMNVDIKGDADAVKADNAYCPDCDAMLIHRMVFDVLNNQINGWRCPRCIRKRK
jgi:hypothetical protein